MDEAGRFAAVLALLREVDPLTRDSPADCWCRATRPRLGWRITCGEKGVFRLWQSRIFTCASIIAGLCPPCVGEGGGASG